MNFDSSIPSFILLQRFGVVEASGTDAGRFLHRMSTNNIDDLKPGESCFTAFLNQKARLVSICYVVNKGDDTYQLLVPFDSPETLMNWLDSYLFSEDVTLRDLSSQFALAWSVGAPSLPNIPGPKFCFKSGAMDSGFHLLEKSQTHELRNALKGQGHRELNEAEFETLRIAGLVPFSIAEINSNYQPIQLGLNEAIHWAKGCYIGQEVISRLESKDKADKTLLGMTAPEADWAKLKNGEAVEYNGQVVGTLTSVAPSYLLGEANALAVFKRAKPSGKMLTDLSQVCIDSVNQGE